MTNEERVDIAVRAYDALALMMGAIMVGSEKVAKKRLDEVYTYIDELYDEYFEDEDEDEDDEDEEQPSYVTDFISELTDMCDYYEAECKISIDFGDGDCYEVEVNNND